MRSLSVCKCVLCLLALVEYYLDKRSAQNGVEIHLRVPRLPGPSSRVKHKQIFLLHAEAKGLGARWYVKTTQKHLPVRFLYALGPKLICFSSYGPRKLLGMFQDHLF